MSSAPSRRTPSRRGLSRRTPSLGRPSVGRALSAAGWTVLLVVLAISAAGLAGLAWHAPGSPARAELTYAADAALAARLDPASRDLARIEADMEALAGEAKRALEEVASVDPKRLQASLDRGAVAAASIDARARSLHDSLAELPGDEADAAMRYSNGALVRRAAILAAVEASRGLAGHWQTVSARASDTARLTSLISNHDITVVKATEQGRNRQYAKAAATLEDALVTMTEIEGLRRRLIATSEHTVLDEWIERTKAYDVALHDLYLALKASKGKVTVEVQSARREERLAFDQLPPDRRTILVIIAEVTRNGLTQAVLAIEDAHSRLDEALAAVGDPASPEPT